MRLSYFIIILFLGLSSCELKEKSEPIRTGVYFDLVKLLDEQAIRLERLRPKLSKELIVNGENETIIMDLDSAKLWKEQLALFYQADINKLGLEKAYLTEELPTGENRKKIIDQAISAKALVRLIEYNYLFDEIQNIRILINDKNTVYNFDKELTLNFSRVKDENCLTSFSIVGDQDMILKSELTYSLKATLIFDLQPE